MAGRDTPMFRKYMEFKALHPDAILFFRVGDFFELFFEDARIAAEVLELTLTSRNKNDPDPIPMAGVPARAIRNYIQGMIDAGYKVVIADQVEDAAQAKGLVRREITRIITPGVGLDPDELKPREPCWLVAIAKGRGRKPKWGLALLDVSTGELKATELSEQAALFEELGRFEIREALVPESMAEDEALTQAPALKDVRISPLEDDTFEHRQATASLCAKFGVADLRGFGCGEMKPGLGAAWATLHYAAGNMRSELPHVTRIAPYTIQHYMMVDPFTRRNLELVKPLRGTGRKGTLIQLLDRSATAMGGRLLREWLAFPLLDVRRIQKRQDAVQAFFQDNGLRSDIRERLREVADLERIASKIAQASANARDLMALRRSLLALPLVVDRLRAVEPFGRSLPTDLCAELAADIGAWLVDDPPVSLTDGGLIRPGQDADLDELTQLSSSGKAALAAIEARERKATGVGSLKVRFSRMIGYYIELSRANRHKAPEHYIARQTLTNSERYITTELKEFEEKITGAEEKIKAIEYQRFVELRDRAAAAMPRVQALAAAVAIIDALHALAEVAVDNRYVRPVVDDGRDLELLASRHPVVEQMELGERFVPNDISLHPNGRQLLIVTGPNMSGKSTVMRQTALIAIMAQMGSFVPATRARIGMCDRVFTRVGASDDITSGQSTFMVEMSETANILHHATDRSLVLLDEIGRGTSTYDGLAIAWAVTEDLHDRVRCRALFATHYHELVELAETRPNVTNVSVKVSEWGERIIFLRQLKDGGASRSYGIQCARLAGMPRPVVERASELLKQLEKHAAVNPGPQLALFGQHGAPGAEGGSSAAAPAAAAAAAPDPVRELLEEIDPDELRPREALDLLYRLKSLATTDETGAA